MATSKKTAPAKKAAPANKSTADKKTSGIGSRASRDKVVDHLIQRGSIQKTSRGGLASRQPASVDLQSIPDFAPNPVESSLLASAQRLLADRAFSYVLRALPAGEASQFDVLEMALNARFTAAMEGPGLVMDGKAMVKLEAGRSWTKFWEQAWTGFAASVIRQSKDMGWRPAVPDVADTRFVDAERIVQKLGGVMAPVGSKPCENIREAWRIAQERLERTNVRLVTLVVLHGAINKLGLPAVAMEEYRLLRQKLLDLRARALLEVFSTGVLVGEEAYPTLRALSRDRYGDSREISQLLQLDNLEPTEMGRAQYESLRASIKASA